MRKSVTATFALTVILSIATPAFATPRDNRDVPAIVKIVRFLKHAFGITSQAEPTIPIP